VRHGYVDVGFVPCLLLFTTLRVPGFFYPVLLLMFGGPGVFFVNLTKKNTRFYNVFMWLMLSVGNALLMVLYSREWFARFGEHPVNYPVCILLLRVW
jgi:hypothetical protein